MRISALLVLFATTASVGCRSDPCPSVSLSGPWHPSYATETWHFEGLAPKTGRCRVELVQYFEDPARALLGKDLVAGVTITCGVEPNDLLSDYLQATVGLGDPRTWRAGEARSLEATIRYWPIDGIGSCTTAPAPRAKVTALTATGGAGDAPPGVTSDYRRVFHVELDFASTPGMPNASELSCAATEATLEASVETTADDFHFDPGDPCRALG